MNYERGKSLWLKMTRENVSWIKRHCWLSHLFTSKLSFALLQVQVWSCWTWRLEMNAENLLRRPLFLLRKRHQHFQHFHFQRIGFSQKSTFHFTSLSLSINHRNWKLIETTAETTVEDRKAFVALKTIKRSNEKASRWVDNLNAIKLPKIRRCEGIND